MTLSTNIYLTKNIPAEMVMQKVIELIDFPGYKYDVEKNSLFGHGGQGAKAWLIVHHANGSLIAPDKYETNTRDSGEVDEYGDPKTWVPEHYVRINMDSAYGLPGGASTFHASIIRQLRDWKLDTEFTFYWENEFTGEIHDSHDEDALRIFEGI